MLDKKTGSLGQIELNLVHPLEATVLLQFLWNYTRMFVLIMGAIGSKSRSPGQILVKFCFHSLSYIFGAVHSNSGERYRAIMALLLFNLEYIFIPVNMQ